MSKMPWWEQPRCAEIIRRVRGKDSQEAFAEMLGLARPQSLSRWENGHSAPSRMVRQRIEEVARMRGVRLS